MSGRSSTGEPGGWRRRAGYGLDARHAGPETFRSGEGLVGRAAEDRALVRVSDVPPDLLKVRSALLESTPAEVLLVPTEGTSHAVLLEASREIRKRPAWAKLPIIAVTAKAMKDDQQPCREAGANDYIAKPLDVDVLLSLLRVWMLR